MSTTKGAGFESRPFLQAHIIRHSHLVSSPKNDGGKDRETNRSLRVKPWPGGNIKPKGAAALSDQSPKKFKSSLYLMLKVRGLNPKNFTLVKDTYTSLYLRDKRDGSIKILYKNPPGL